MKIHDQLIAKLSQIQNLRRTQVQGRRDGPKGTAEDQSASIEFSRQGTLVHKVQEELRTESPDPMREAELEVLKAAIEDGTFHVDADEVSLKILRDALRE